ncbi:mCG146825 [Mus musculus]|nr:mCG146825 [Mus musculus]
MMTFISDCSEVLLKISRYAPPPIPIPSGWGNLWILAHSQ